ncbi:hypothetical protein MASR2M36_20610 [Providencia sp.]
MINKNTLMKGKIFMTMQKQNNSDIGRINKIKAAIATRKYAHADEISLLWRYAMKSSQALSWQNIMCIALISSAIICTIILWSS